MWSRPGSNRRPIAFQANALPTELQDRDWLGQSGLRSHERIRTPDLTDYCRNLCALRKLSYMRFAVPTGFEPVTSTLRGWRALHAAPRDRDHFRFEQTLRSWRELNPRPRQWH